MHWQTLARLAGTELIVALLALPVFAGAILKENEQVAKAAFGVIFVAAGTALLWGSTAALIRIWE